MINRNASCSCGQLNVVVEGDPKMVVACNCLSCQKRTGSVFAASSYFDDAQIVEKKGESQSLRRTTDSGREIERNFCPRCGSTVFWKADISDHHTGIGVGSFADPDFPEPTLCFWTKTKHQWVSFPEYWKCMQEFS